MYLTTEDDLRRTFETAWTHCKPGGVVVLAPDWVRENFKPATDYHGHDGADRALRCLGWEFDPDPSDTTYEVHFAFLLREGQRVWTEHDHHVFGLFARDDWLRLLREVCFQPTIITDPVDPDQRDVFVARKPGA